MMLELEGLDIVTDVDVDRVKLELVDDAVLDVLVEEGDVVDIDDIVELVLDANVVLLKTPV